MSYLVGLSLNKDYKLGEIIAKGSFGTVLAVSKEQNDNKRDLVCKVSKDT